MKKAILAISLLLLAFNVYGQQGTVVNSFFDGTDHYIQITLTNSGGDRTDDVYVLWPNTSMGYGGYMSETAPTATTGNLKHRSFFTGDAYLCMEPNGTAGEDDSLRVRMYPLVYDPIDKAYDTIDGDVTYLVFGSAGTYTASSQNYLDFTDGVEYAVPLGSLLMPCEGIKLDFDIDDNGTFSCVINVWLKIVQ